MLSREGRCFSSAFLAIANGIWPIAKWPYISVAEAWAWGFPWWKHFVPHHSHLGLPGHTSACQGSISRAGSRTSFHCWSRGYSCPVWLEGDQGMVQTRVDCLCPAHVPVNCWNPTQPRTLSRSPAMQRVLPKIQQNSRPLQSQGVTTNPDWVRAGPLSISKAPSECGGRSVNCPLLPRRR